MNKDIIVNNKNMVTYDDSDSNSDSESKKEAPQKIISKKIVPKKVIKKERSESEAESEVEAPQKIISKKAVPKKVIKKERSESEAESDSENDSDSDSEEEVPKKVILKKSVLKKEIKKEEKEENDVIDNKIEEHQYSIDNLLTTRNYVMLTKCIPKYKIITSKDVNKIISSKSVIHYDDDFTLMEILLKKIIERGYVMTKENYLEMIKQTSMYGYWNTKKFSSREILKNFSIKDDEVDEFCTFVKNNRIRYINFESKSLNLNDKKTLENMVFILCTIGDWNQIESFIEEMKIPITEKSLKYTRNVTVRKHIQEIMTKSVTEAKQIKKNNKDVELLESETIDEIENYVIKNDYEITTQTIILACQNNIDKDILNHLLSYKINFDEESVNEIIKSYRDNDNIEKMLLFMCQYGYQFKKSNYIEMLSSKYYYTLFHGNLVTNFVLDDELTDFAYNAYKRYPDNFVTFLSNIEYLGNQNKITAESILALYCSIGSEVKIKKLVKEYNFKLTVKCLKYLYKQKSNILKGIIGMFKKDKVKPDLDVFKQYIDTFAQRREQVYLYELLEDN
jgi:hypothetical protein